MVFTDLIPLIAFVAIMLLVIKKGGRPWGK